MGSAKRRRHAATLASIVKVNAEQSNVKYHLNMDRDASATLRKTHAVTEYIYYFFHPSTHPLFTASYHVYVHMMQRVT